MIKRRPALGGVWPGGAIYARNQHSNDTKGRATLLRVGVIR